MIRKKKKIQINKSSIMILLILLLVAIVGFDLSLNVKKGVTTEPNTCSKSGQCVEAHPETKDEKRWNRHSNALRINVKEALPKSEYGGMWIGEVSRKVVIGLVNNPDTFKTSKEVVFREAKKLGIRDGVEVAIVKYPYETLWQTRNAISKLIRENIREEDWPIQVGMKTDQNKVQVDIPLAQYRTNGHRVVLAEIEKMYQDQVILHEYTEMPQLE